MKRFFNWIAGLFTKKPPVVLPEISRVTAQPGYCECIVRPVTYKGLPFFIHFLSNDRAEKMKGVATRVGIELADALRQCEFGENPLRFSFNDARDAIENWNKQAVIAEVRSIVGAMGLVPADERYLALRSYGTPALMFRMVLLNDVLMTVCFSQSDMLSENEPVEWLRDDPVVGFTLPQMVLETAKTQRLSFVQKQQQGGSISVMLDPSVGYVLDKVQSLSTDVLEVASLAYSEAEYRLDQEERFLDIVASIYASLRQRLSLTFAAGHYYDRNMGVFAIMMAVDTHPPMLLVFMPKGFEPSNLPAVDALAEAIRGSVNRPYPLGNVLAQCGVPVQEPTLSFNEFHEKQVRARVAPITRLVFDKTMGELMKSSSCPGEELNHRFSQSDVYALFSLTSCPPEFARVVAEKCENLRWNRAKDLAGTFIMQYHEEHGNEYSDARFDAFIAKHRPAQGVLEAEVRKELLQLGVIKRNREFAQRVAGQVIGHRHTTHIERPRFRDDWRDVSHPDPMVQAAVLTTIMENDPPAHRCEAPVSEPVCRDESPSYDCGSSNTYNPD
jgi:hypothetical protein